MPGRDAVAMNDYLIGSGAMITAGPRAGLAAATIHAQTDPALASLVTAMVVDFEATSIRDLSRLVVAATGWRRDRAGSRLIEPLLARGTCTLADVLTLLGTGSGASTVHVFARWLPDEPTVAQLRASGIELVAHPLEAIAHAALVCGDRFERWSPGMRAA
jgi:hypothetical protein